MNSKNLSKAINRMLAILLTAAMVAGSFTVPVKAEDVSEQTEVGSSSEDTASEAPVKENDEPEQAVGSSLDAMEMIMGEDGVVNPDLIGAADMKPLTVKFKTSAKVDEETTGLVYTGKDQITTLFASGNVVVYNPDAPAETLASGYEVVFSYGYLAPDSEIWVTLDKASSKINKAGKYKVTAFATYVNGGKIYAGQTEPVEFEVAPYKVDAKKASGDAYDSVIDAEYLFKYVVKKDTTVEASAPGTQIGITDGVFADGDKGDNKNVNPDGTDVTDANHLGCLEYNGNALIESNIERLLYLTPYADAANKDLLTALQSDLTAAYGISAAATAGVATSKARGIADVTEELDWNLGGDVISAGDDSAYIEISLSKLTNFEGTIKVPVKIGQKSASNTYTVNADNTYKTVDLTKYEDYVYIYVDDILVDSKGEFVPISKLAQAVGSYSGFFAVAPKIVNNYDGDKGKGNYLRCLLKDESSLTVKTTTMTIKPDLGNLTACIKDLSGYVASDVITLTLTGEGETVSAVTAGTWTIPGAAKGAYTGTVISGAGNGFKVDITDSSAAINTAGTSYEKADFSAGIYSKNATTDKYDVYEGGTTVTATASPTINVGDPVPVEILPIDTVLQYGKEYVIRLKYTNYNGDTIKTQSFDSNPFKLSSKASTLNDTTVLTLSNSLTNRYWYPGIELLDKNDKAKITVAGVGSDTALKEGKDYEITYSDASSHVNDNSGNAVIEGTNLNSTSRAFKASDKDNAIGNVYKEQSYAKIQGIGNYGGSNATAYIVLDHIKSATPTAPAAKTVYIEGGETSVEGQEANPHKIELPDTYTLTDVNGTKHEFKVKKYAISWTGTLVNNIKNKETVAAAGVTKTNGKLVLTFDTTADCRVQSPTPQTMTVTLTPDFEDADAELSLVKSTFTLTVNVTKEPVLKKLTLEKSADFKSNRLDLKANSAGTQLEVPSGVSTNDYPKVLVDGVTATSVTDYTGNPTAKYFMHEDDIKTFVPTFDPAKITNPEEGVDKITVPTDTKVDSTVADKGVYWNVTSGTTLTGIQGKCVVASATGTTYAGRYIVKWTVSPVAGKTSFNAEEDALELPYTIVPFNLSTVKLGASDVKVDYCSGNLTAIEKDTINRKLKQESVAKEAITTLKIQLTGATAAVDYNPNNASTKLTNADLGGGLSYEAVKAETPDSDGNYAVDIYIRGSKNLAGTLKVTDTDAIEPALITNAVLVGSANDGSNVTTAPSYEYTGEAIEPDLLFVVANTSEGNDKVYYARDLVNEDYVMTYGNNKAAYDTTLSDTTGKTVATSEPYASISFKGTMKTGDGEPIKRGFNITKPVLDITTSKSIIDVPIYVDKSGNSTQTFTLPREITDSEGNKYGVTGFDNSVTPTVVAGLSSNSTMFSGSGGTALSISNTPPTTDLVLNFGIETAAKAGDTCVYTIKPKIENYALTGNSNTSGLIKVRFTIYETEGELVSISNFDTDTTNFVFNNKGISVDQLPKASVTNAAGDDISSQVEYKFFKENGVTKALDEIDLKTEGYPKNAGDYHVSAFIDNNNYKAPEVGFDFSIAKFPIKATGVASGDPIAVLKFADGKDNVTYNGEAFVPETTITLNFAGAEPVVLTSAGDEPDYVLAGSGANDLKDCPTYVNGKNPGVTVKVDDVLNENFDLGTSGTEPTAKFYINKRPLHISLKDIEVKKGGTETGKVNYAYLKDIEDGLVDNGKGIKHVVDSTTAIKQGNLIAGNFVASETQEINIATLTGKNIGDEFYYSVTTPVIKQGTNAVTSNYDVIVDKIATITIVEDYSEKEEIQPVITIKDESGKDITGKKVIIPETAMNVTVGVSPDTLKEGTHYVLSWTPSGEKKEKGVYTVTLTGVENEDYNVKTATASFEIIEKPEYEVTGITVSPKALTLKKEGTGTINYTVTGQAEGEEPKDVTAEEDVTITPAASTNFTVSVAEKGVINVAAKAGAVEGESETFTITAGEKSATFTLTVKPPFVVGSVKLSRTSLRLDPGAYENITYTVKDTEGNDVTSDTDVSLEGALGSPITAAMTERGTIKVAAASDADVKATNSFKVVCQGTEFATLNVSIKGGSGEPDPGTPVEEPSEYEKPGEDDYPSFDEGGEISVTGVITKKCTYNGKPQEPAVKVTGTGADGKKLVAGTDYKVTYANNVNATNDGEAIAIISGIGKYAGSKEVKFAIAPKKLGGTVVAGAVEKPEEGKPSADDIEEAISVYDGTKLLNYGDDYEIAESSIAEGKGKYDFVITYMGNYTGSKKASVKMTVENDLALCDVEVMFGDKYEATYTGKAFTVKNGNMSIKVTDPEGKEVTATAYSVTYKNNTNVGVGTVTLKGKKPYAGSKVVRFVINRNEDDDSVIKADNITVNNGKTMTYTGKLLKPSVKVQAMVNGKMKNLSKNKDYVVYYSSELNAGTGYVVIRPIGNYEGQDDVVKKFTINKADFKKTSIKKNSEKKSGIYFNGKKLVEGEDFTAKITSVDTKGKYTITVSVVPEDGSRNFQGSATKTIKGTKDQIDWQQLFEVDSPDEL